MCLYPRLIQNAKYKENAKNGGIIPTVNDVRALYVPIGCGNCIECRKQKARGWQIRLLEDIKTNRNGKFITLTFSNESIDKLITEVYKDTIIPNEHPKGYELDNRIAAKAIRLFTERWRKEYKKAVRHFLVTELGHNGTENVHLHGIIWTDKEYNTIKRIWKYGYIWPREKTTKTYVNEKTVNYIIKYVTKQDTKHKHYKSIILTSKGIGANYTRTTNSNRNKYKETDTDETYRTKQGYTIAMPTYWRNKLYTEEEREKLWMQRLDKQERFICGERVDISEGDKEYWELLKWYRRKNTELGYGDDKRKWKQEAYEKHSRQIAIMTRAKQATHSGATLQ